MEMRSGVHKQSIRNKYLSCRDAMTKSERLAKSMKIWERLKGEESFRNADVILVYMDYRSEVMTTGLVEELLLSNIGKRIFAPVVEGLDIVFYEIYSLEDLHPGYQGIREPKAELNIVFTEETAKNNQCFLLTPGSVFDRQMGRMGYGKGFYDRFLNRYGNDVTSAGLAFSCQIAPMPIPSEIHDRKMDMIVTEDEIFFYRKGK
jgi:5-formyltetrahydrofolate cyclo-ligase